MTTPFDDPRIFDPSMFAWWGWLGIALVAALVAFVAFLFVQVGEDSSLTMASTGVVLVALAVVFVAGVTGVTLLVRFVWERG